MLPEGFQAREGDKKNRSWAMAVLEQRRRRADGPNTVRVRHMAINCAFAVVNFILVLQNLQHHKTSGTSEIFTSTRENRVAPNILQVGKCARLRFSGDDNGAGYALTAYQAGDLIHLHGQHWKSTT